MLLDLHARIAFHLPKGALDAGQVTPPLRVHISHDFRGPQCQLALLPALQRPTISSLSDADWVAVNTIIEERTVRDLMPKLKAAGAQGLVEYPLNKIVL